MLSKPAASAAAADGCVTFKAWLEAGVANASLTYAYAQNVPFLADPLPARRCLAGPPAPSTRILLLGDSINRQVLQAGCGDVGGRAPSAPIWTEQFTYREGASVSHVCELPLGEGSVAAFLHVYGAAANGPYYMGHGSQGHSTPEAVEFCGDTAERIPEALRQFTAKFGGPPTVVLFHSEVWDLMDTGLRIEKGLLARRDLGARLNAYVLDLRRVFAQLRAALGPHALLGIHTVPLIMRDADLYHGFSNAMRLFARTSDVFMLDWGRLVQPLTPEETQADKVHPNGPILQVFFRVLTQSIAQWEGLPTRPLR